MGKVKIPALNNIRILVVDDNADARELLAHMIKSAGGKVEMAASAEAAYKIVERWRPDIIIADINMPDEDGHAFMKRIRTGSKEEGAQIPAIAITGYGPEDRLTAFRCGYQNYIRKPLNSDELVASIASLAL